MILTKEHFKFYQAKKFKVKSKQLSIFKPNDKLSSIHTLINNHCDITSLLRHDRGRPQDKNYAKANLYNLINKVNKKGLTSPQFINYLLNTGYTDKVRKAIIKRIIGKLKINT